MAELLLEIFSEEIPARMQPRAALEFKGLAEKELKNNQIAFAALKTFITPRRLVLVAYGLEIVQSVSSSERKGPSVDADSEIISSFAKSLSIDVSDLFIKKIKDKEYYFATLSVAHKNLHDTLPRILERVMGELSWPKSMKWDESRVRWVRPVRNILCVLNGEILPISFGNLKSNNLSFGHRFLAAKEFKVTNFAGYEKALQENYVILDSQARKQIILDNISRIEKELKLEWTKDDWLLDEVTGLVEYPFVLFGKIDEEFLSLPKEVLISCMRKHQKYFALKNADGSFASYFIVVSNNLAQDAGAQIRLSAKIDTQGDSNTGATKQEATAVDLCQKSIVAGNENVLTARLKDAKFFFEEDKKTPLASKVEKLKGVVYHQSLGSIFDKVERIIKLSKKIAAQTQSGDVRVIDKIAYLAKADLTTNVVGEFPDLQGIIGAYYAKFDQEEELISRGICEHYLPIGKDSALPSSIEAAIVSIADKMDSITGIFSIGDAPTSSRDPYALRRSALGIIRIICEYKVELSIISLIKDSLSLHGQHKMSNLEDAQNKVYSFFFDRFKFWLKDDFREDCILAVLKKSEGNIYVDYLKLKHMTEFLSHGTSKVTVFALKRVVKIVQENKSLISKADGPIDEKKLSNDHEKGLLIEIERLEGKIHKNIKHHEYLKAFNKLSELAQLINNFFDEVMVMVDDVEIKTNRLKILKKIYDLLDLFVAFSLIEL